GDRRLAAVIETAWKSGCRFDGWDDVFQPALWQAAFASCGLDPSFYANRRKGFEEFLPWEVLDYGVSRAFLERENARARRAETTPSCREKCAGCGANALNGGSCDAND
nr:B12-binding domain-containing radical SAM protein [Clostridiales bacterium]